MELITGFTPGEGGEGAQVRRTRVERKISIDFVCNGSGSIFCGIVVFPFYPFLPPCLPPSLQPAAHHIPPWFSRICSWTCSPPGKKKWQYYIAIMRCWLPCLTLYCQSRSRSPEAGRKKKLKVVPQEHDFPPEILFVVVQHMWHTQATRRQQEGIDSSKGHRVNT